MQNNKNKIHITNWHIKYDKILHKGITWNDQSTPKYVYLLNFEGHLAFNQKSSILQEITIIQPKYDLKYEKETNRYLTQ